MAECGPDGWSLWNGDVIDMIARPASLAACPTPMPSMSWAFDGTALSTPASWCISIPASADRGRLCPGAAPSQNDGDPPLA